MTNQNVNLIVDDDMPQGDIGNIWQLSYELEEPCFSTCLADALRDCQKYVSAGYNVLLHGGQKTFMLTLENGTLPIQWMPNSNC